MQDNNNPTVGNSVNLLLFLDPLSLMNFNRLELYTL